MGICLFHLDKTNYFTFTNCKTLNLFSGYERNIIDDIPKFRYPAIYSAHWLGTKLMR